VPDGSDAATRPLTTVIVCSRNRPDLLCDSVQSVLDGSEAPTELIVIDQSDDANTRLQELARSGMRSDLRYHWTPSRGLSAALNIGIRAARCPALLFTHDDVWVDGDWHRSMVDAMMADDRGSVLTGRVLPEVLNDTGGRFVPSTKTDTAPHSYAGRIWDDVLYPLNMAMRREMFDIVGPFDERLGPGTPYPAAEDNDYGYRVLDAGYRIEYIPSAVVQHRAWRDDPVSLRWDYALGQGGFFAKHVAALDWYMVCRAGRELARYSARAVTCAVRGDSRARGYAVSAIGLVAGMTRWTFIDRLGAR
jgi:GT2 family glycosyltransferase